MELNVKNARTVDSIKQLQYVNQSDSVIVSGFHEPHDGGGGVFIWKDDEPKSNHNGGTIIDPLVQFPSTWPDSLWYSSTNTGNGCWVRLYDGELNVKWFGAKGDGVSDDTIPIQQTINNNNIILFPSSENFLISSSITIANQNTVIDFNNSTILFNNDITYGFKCNINSYFKNGIIDGKSHHGPAIELANGTKIENLEIKNIYATSTIVGITVSNIIINNNYIHDCGNEAVTGTSAGIDIDNGSSNIIISNNIISDIYGNCITIYQEPTSSYISENVNILNNILGPTTRLDGIQLYYQCKNVNISNNIIYDWDRAAITIDNGQNNSVDNNICINSKAQTLYGISLVMRNSNGLKVSNNKIHNNYIYIPSATYGYNIGIEATQGECSHNLISENYIYDNNFAALPTASIYISGSSYTTISNNRIYKSKTHGIYISNNMFSSISNNYIEYTGTDSNLFGSGIYINGGNSYNQTFSIIKNNTLIYPANGGDGITVSTGATTIINNYIYDWNNPTLMRYAINETIVADSNIIKDNIIKHRTTESLINTKTNPLLSNNIGYLTSNYGTITLSGDGTTTTFSFAHNLIKPPTTIFVNPMSSDASSQFYISADDTNITITYNTAPPSGTNNLIYSWQATV